jgi:hypothetical protein
LQAQEIAQDFPPLTGLTPDETGKLPLGKNDRLRESIVTKSQQFDDLGIDVVNSARQGLFFPINDFF